MLRKYSQSLRFRILGDFSLVREAIFHVGVIIRQITTHLGTGFEGATFQSQPSHTTVRGKGQVHFKATPSSQPPRLSPSPARFGTYVNCLVPVSGVYITVLIFHREMVHQCVMIYYELTKDDRVSYKRLFH
jgi:hypothetical protein